MTTRSHWDRFPAATCSTSRPSTSVRKARDAPRRHRGGSCHLRPAGGRTQRRHPASTGPTAGPASRSRNTARRDRRSRVRPSGDRPESTSPRAPALLPRRPSPPRPLRRVDRAGGSPRAVTGRSSPPGCSSSADCGLASTSPASLATPSTRSSAKTRSRTRPHPPPPPLRSSSSAARWTCLRSTSPSPHPGAVPDQRQRHARRPVARTNPALDLARVRLQLDLLQLTAGAGPSPVSECRLGDSWPTTTGRAPAARAARSHSRSRSATTRSGRGRPTARHRTARRRRGHRASRS